MSVALVIRRAHGSPRDCERVAAALKAEGEPVGESLAAALRDDRWGVVLAERAGAMEGALVLRFVHAVGASPGDAPVRAFVDAVFAREDAVRDALRAAASAEIEARELASLDAPPAPVPVPVPTAPEEPLRVGDEALLRFTPGEAPAPMVTRWSGGGAFRARWRSDLAESTWSVSGCVGAEDDDGDSLRFDRDARTLREAYFTRPARVSRDTELLARIRALPTAPGALRLDPAVRAFSLPRTTIALFDVSLDVFAALCDEAGEGTLRAVSVSDALSLLFVDDRYAGWRVRDPVSLLRPMGWPDVREGDAPTRLDALLALTHDWMVIDGTTRPRPDEVSDPEEIAHMTALRGRARALASEGEPDDPTPGVAKDIGAHIHWGWGFFRVPDEG
ncbi:MAG: hypothetical protein R3A48_05445 [Polyangiales bacterium]